MIRRPEIVDHIRLIFWKIDEHREEMVTQSAQAVVLSVKLADARLAEVLSARRSETRDQSR
jgi:hypothetical protein